MLASVLSVRMRLIPPVYAAHTHTHGKHAFAERKFHRHRQNTRGACKKKKKRTHLNSRSSHIRARRQPEKQRAICSAQKFPRAEQARTCNELSRRSHAQGRHTRNLHGNLFFPPDSSKHSDKCRYAVKADGKAHTRGD